MSDLNGRPDGLSRTFPHRPLDSRDDLPTRRTVGLRSALPRPNEFAGPKTQNPDSALSVVPASFELGDNRQWALVFASDCKPIMFLCQRLTRAPALLVLDERADMHLIPFIAPTDLP